MEGERSLRDYASLGMEDIHVQQSDLMPKAAQYKIKAEIIKMAAANPFQGIETDNPYRHIKQIDHNDMQHGAKRRSSS
jgi:hypothetical protein